MRPRKMKDDGYTVPGQRGRCWRLGLTLWLCLPCYLMGQSLVPAEWPPWLQLSAGLRLWVGTPANQVGLDLRAAATWRMLQVNAGTSLQYNWQPIGPPASNGGLEWQSYLGAVAGFGPAAQAKSPFLHPIAQQTGRRYAAAYALKWYQDGMGTSQLTALLGLHLGGWLLASENDAYTGRLDDRWRTGSLALTYRRDSLRVGLTSVLWTGNARAKGVIRRQGYGRFGYKDLSAARYGGHSRGILALEASYALPYCQAATLRLGLDAEQVRHVLQNLLIHDMPFLPARWLRARNPRYPMLTPEGRPYLGEPGQRIRPPRLYLQGGLNPALFY